MGFRSLGLCTQRGSCKAVFFFFFASSLARGTQLPLLHFPTMICWVTLAQKQPQIEAFNLWPVMTPSFLQVDYFRHFVTVMESWLKGCNIFVSMRILPSNGNPSHQSSTVALDEQRRLLSHTQCWAQKLEQGLFCVKSHTGRAPGRWQQEEEEVGGSKELIYKQPLK